MNANENPPPWEPLDDPVVHACPPRGEVVTPCCGRTPFELPRGDRMTLKKRLVTCTGAPAQPTERGPSAEEIERAS